MATIEEVRVLLTKMPRKSLGFYPTSLHRLDVLSGELGVNLYAKRDDRSGISTFGGNKMRKLEYLLGDAVEQGADTVFTFGATQSNHAMQTAAACCKLGLKPVLYLVSVVEPNEDDVRANLLLDRIYGAEVHIVSPEPGETMTDMSARSREMAQQHADELRAQGGHPYIVPGGGASDVGSIGFVMGYIELMSQCQARCIKPRYVFHATGSGGTLAGLAAGRALVADTFENPQIVSIAVSAKSEGYEAQVADLANAALARLGAGDARVDAADLLVDTSYYGAGYEIPSPAGNDAIRRLARSEGVLTDPVYTGKAFAGLLDYVESGRIPQGSDVIFWHTGGATALFSESAIIGDLVCEG